MTKEVVDLLIVGHIFLGKDRLYLVKVPVGNVGHLIYLLRTATHMSILAIRPADAEAKAIVIALTVASGQHHHLLHTRCLVRPCPTIFP